MVESLDSLLCGLCGRQSDKTITSGAGTTEDDVGGYAGWDEEVKEAVSGCHVHVVLNRRKESLQPFIRGGVRKIASEDLGGVRWRRGRK